MNCIFCNGPLRSGSGIDGYECRVCGTTIQITHPDPIMLAMQILRNTNRVDGYIPKIPAIKAYRKVTGDGLREAKQVIDKLVEAIKLDEDGYC